MKKVRKNLFNRYTIVILLITIISFIIIIIIPKKQETSYILVSNTNALKCKLNDCQNENLEELVDKELPNFDVYNPKYLGEFKAQFNKKWNFFDLNGNWSNVPDGFIAASKSLKLQLADYSPRTVLNNDELSYLNSVLKKENITKYTNLEQLVIEYNLNNDLNLEKLIIVSNDTLESKDEILFSAIIGYVNNKYEILEFMSVKNEEFYLLPAYRLKGIININNNKNYYILLIKGYYSEEKESSLLLYESSNYHLKNILME